MLAWGARLTYRQNHRWSRTQSKSSGWLCHRQWFALDASVPMKIIEVLPEELQGDQADNYEILSYKVTHRLAQQQASFVVIEERRPVIREKTQKLITTPAPIAYWTTASPMSAFGRNAGGQVSIPLTPAPATSEINGGGYHRFSKPAYPIDQQSHCLAQTHCGGAVLQRTAESGAGHRRDAHQGRPERAGKNETGLLLAHVW